MRGNRGARRAMDRMGLSMKEIPDVEKVVIYTATKEMILSKPQVAEMGTKEGTIYTVQSDGCEEVEREAPSYSEGDVDIICQQTGADRGRAAEALAESGGDLAQAILTIRP